MLPSARFSVASPAQRLAACGGLNRPFAGPNKRSVCTVAVSRAPAVKTSCRLVLRPTGSGSCEHIGDEVPRPGAILLQEGVYEVGRGSPADIQIPIPTVSSRHALLRVEGDRVCITDLNSTNGTLVNGQELGPLDNMEVEVGAEVIFGDVYLAKFRLDEMDEDAAAAGKGGGASASAAAVAAAKGGGQQGGVGPQQELSDQGSVHGPAPSNNAATLSS